jgi:hypothetical protein
LLLSIFALARPGHAQEVADVGTLTTPDLPRGMSLDDEPRTILRLTSGEWVQGELLYVEDGDLSLEGDKTSDTVYDLEDVLEVHSSERLQCTFSDGEKLDARWLSLDDEGRVELVDEAGERHFRRRAQLLAVYPLVGDEDPILDRWRGSGTPRPGPCWGSRR